MGWQDAPVIGGEAQPKWASAPMADAQPVDVQSTDSSPDDRAAFLLSKGVLTDAERAEMAQLEESSAYRPLRDSVKRQIGRTGRIVAEGIGALPLTVMNAGVAARNLITGSSYQMPSEMYAESLDATGLPRAEGLLEKGVDIAGQIIVGSKIPAPTIKAPAPAQFSAKTARSVAALAADDVIKEGQKHGVPVFFDDLTQSSIAKKASVAAENLGPLGTGSGRAAQAKAAQAAAQKVVQRLAVEGDDVPTIVQKGLQTRLDQFRTAADRLYTRAATELDQFGSIKTDAFDDVIKQQIARQEQLGTVANTEVINTLRAYEAAPRGNFSLMRELRSQLSSKISEYYGGNKAIGDKGVGALQAAKDALDADLAKFAKSTGGAGYNYWKAADGFYKANLAPFKEAGLKALVRSPEPEKAWRFLVAQGGVKSRADRMYRALDETGRSAVRYGLAKDAMESATNPNGSFSPARFAKYMEGHEDTVSTFFKGTDLKEINGFSNLMRHVERAGQFAENPPTGQRLLLPLLAGAATVEPTMAGTAAGSGLALRALFQTQTGRDFLLSMANRKPGSAEMQSIVDRVARYLVAATAVTASSSESESQQEE